jgi:tetratricopeptide (TPR) repeat protein
MKTSCVIGFVILLALAACDTTTREARRMVRRAEQLADTLPDSTARLIDSVLRTPASFSERERMDMALLQAEALFGDRGEAISPIMDDDFFDHKGNLSTSPELERAAAYYAGKKQYAKAAHAALYSGFVQQHYNEKESAMRSFKEAEQYGKLAVDSLCVAQAQYRMGKMLLYDGMKQEALDILQNSILGFDNRWVDKSLVMNMMGGVNMLLGQYDAAASCLDKSLAYAKEGNSSKAKQKTLNNYAVLCRLQRRYDDAIAYLRQMAGISNLSENELFVFYLNMGKIFSAANELDSAAVYFSRLDTLLPFVDVGTETKASAYGALDSFSEQQGNIQKSLQFKEQREDLLYKVLEQRQEQAVFRIQQQYDYESLQNEMNRKLIQKQRFVTLFGILTIIGLTVLAVSQIRLAKARKQEAETKANLFHFMQQNKELVQKSEEQKQSQIYLTKKHKESEQAYEDLLKEKEMQEQTVAEYGEKLSYELKKEQSVMLRLHLFLQNQGDDELLKKLEKSVFGKQAHLDAMMETVDRLYPGLREIVKQEDLGLDENEQMDVIMSYFNISRQDEALLLDKTTDMVDKIRNRSRKKIQAASEGNKLPKMM